MKTRSVLAAALFAVSLSACAVRYERRDGVVTDFDTGSPMSNVIVKQCSFCGDEINGGFTCDNAKRIRTTKTDPFGQFRLPESKAVGGACVTNLRFEKPGYEPIELKRGVEPQPGLIGPDGRWHVALRAQAQP